jgi:hypothetical protein
LNLSPPGFKAKACNQAALFLEVYISSCALLSMKKVGIADEDLSPKTMSFELREFDLVRWKINRLAVN